MQANGLLPFQQCTVNWVLKNLTDSKRTVKRFLVADEVGLGKTKVASEVIQGFLAKKPNLFVIYITSNLDISEQNKVKLCKLDKEIISCDRVCLIYNQKIRRSGLRLLSMTPTTSFDLSRGTGSMLERAYIARYIVKRFYVNRQNLIACLRGSARVENFEIEFDKTRLKSNHQMPPERICKEIDKLWSELGLIDKINSFKIDSERNKIVSDLRMQMAKAILKSLPADLIILDEVQKFPNIIKTNESGELEHESAKELFLKTTPTLLLSATPFKAFISAAEINNKNLHVKELEKILRFLTGHTNTTQNITTDLKNYANNIKKIESSKDLDNVFKLKAKIESKLMKYIARAERINFEENAKAPIQEYIMNINRFKITSDHIVEFLKLKNEVRSKRSFLHLWRSGQSPNSYMSEYKVLDPIKKHKHLKKDKFLFSKPGHSDRHCKLSYLKEDLLKQRELTKFLWLPPTKPYYQGSGIYADSNLKNFKPKKGLVFSSWTFVPEMIAAELSAWSDKNGMKGPSKHPLKESVLNYARFWHPSPWLANLITVDDFQSFKTYDELLKSAEQKIKKDLISKDWKILKVNTDPWSVLAKIDFSNDDEFKETTRKYFKRTKNEFTRSKSNRSGALKASEFNRLYKYSNDKVINPATIKQLAHITLSSPAICLLRSMHNTGTVKQTFGGENLALMADFCARNWKSFFNRDGISKVIHSSYSNRYSYAEKLQKYFKDGNFQAVLDEYIFHIQTDKKKDAFKDVLRKISVIFSSKGGSINIKSGFIKPKTVKTEMITQFGASGKQSQSRESVRESFNSPFWPFILATTSVGQEGLDFHLYCKDIYHWNLPSNPVDFEQREGRINRFNSLWIRETLVNTVKLPKPDGRLFWGEIYKHAPNFAHRNDRYNLGMSPNWTFTPNTKFEKRGYKRHILAMPGSEENLRYQSLLQDLELYRLTLGQPNQSKMLEELKNKPYLSKIDLRGIIICLFPYDYKYLNSCLFDKFKDAEQMKLLIKDAKDLTLIHKNKTDFKEITKLVNKHINILKGNFSKYKKEQSLKALIYFVNAHDKTHDRTPDIGWKDDLKQLKAA